MWQQELRDKYPPQSRRIIEILKRLESQGFSEKATIDH